MKPNSYMDTLQIDIVRKEVHGKWITTAFFAR